ncbi:hypothetical protein L2E82_18403 [Cichorium intybus]|uniref:Uncharacterized protein n=1 Tax=Cichorium intybus TaxID=13427 RepID=A0ACB9FA32_CICIN|nr:hypothetical protein L2E82_18403 [Cichorium intybus]
MPKWNLRSTFFLHIRLFLQFEAILNLSGCMAGCSAGENDEGKERLAAAMTGNRGRSTITQILLQSSAIYITAIVICPSCNEMCTSETFGLLVSKEDNID